MTPVFRQIAHKRRVTLFGSDMTRILNQYDWLVYIEKVNDGCWLDFNHVRARSLRFNFFFI